MPRQFAQIQDFSSRAGEKLLDILGKQISTADILSNVLNKATRAYDSNEMAKAAALQESMRAQGFDPDAIRGALAGAGFRSGIVGSKELQNRYEKANQAQLAKAAFDNTMRVQGLKEEADALTADLAKFASETGAENGYMWFEDNGSKLDANPYAYKAAMDYAKANGLTLTPYRSPDSANSVLLKDPTVVEGYMNSLKKIISQASARGIDTSLSPDEAIKNTDFDAWVANQAKLLGYGNDGAGFSDFQENMRDAWNTLRRAVPNATPESILYAMKMNMDNGGKMWRWFGTDQENIDTDKALAWLQTDAANWQTLYNNAFKAKKAHAELEKAYLNNTIQNVLSGVATKEKQLNDLVKVGKLSEARKQEALNNTISRANTVNNAIAQALIEAAQLQKTYPSFNIK